MYIPALDTLNCNIRKYFDKTNEWIKNIFDESENNRVLIHCFAGKSRTSAFTLAYLMKEEGINLKNGLELIK